MTETAEVMANMLSPQEAEAITEHHTVRWRKRQAHTLPLLVPREDYDTEALLCFILWPFVGCPLTLMAVLYAVMRFPGASFWVFTSIRGTLGSMATNEGMVVLLFSSLFVLTATIHTLGVVAIIHHIERGLWRRRLLRNGWIVPSFSDSTQRGTPYSEKP